jgi:hypothetical protein
MIAHQVSRQSYAVKDLSSVRDRNELRETAALRSGCRRPAQGSRFRKEGIPNLESLLMDVVKLRRRYAVLAGTQAGR